VIGVMLKQGKLNMKIEELKRLFDEENTDEIVWAGECKDCRCEVEVIAKRSDSEISISGGVVYNPKIDGNREYFLKCDECYKRDPVLRDWQPVECYSRIVGYLRPTSNWNGAKKSEFGMRRNFKQP
jgi:hypothetical protein